MKSIKTALFGIFAAFILSACGGGGGGGGVSVPPITLTLSMVTCADGSMKLSRSFCQKTCADGTKVSEDFEGCLQTCDSGIRIDENEVCTKFCGDSRRIPETESCEFRTREYGQNRLLEEANPIPAYERGFFGQGVTVVLANGNGFRVTHEDLADNIILEDTGIDGQENRVVPTGSHGTAVAGVLGAVRGNGKGSHGIAPSVKIIPLDSVSGTITYDVWRYAALNDHPIFHQSSSYNVDFIITAQIAAITTDSSFAVWAATITQAIGDSDTQMVWSAGNGSLNLVDVRPRNAMAYMPLIEENLQDNILVVVNLDSNNVRADSSDGCGVTRLWCIGAVAAERHFTTGADDNSDYVGLGGTSGAAPIVSGALAILKSARPELPMTMHRQILLSTATPLGTRAINQSLDEVYGWGAVNIGAAVSALLTVRVAQNGVLLSDLRGSLPYEMSHLRGRLSEVSVALKITDDSYYNIPLSDIVGGDSQKTKLGNAAKEMQADDFTAGESFRFWGGLEYDGSRSSYIGEGGGIFSAENASDTGGYVKWATANYGGISAFGEYGRTQIKADYDSNSFVSKIQNARAEEWAAGFQYRDLFLHNDNLQFSARQESRISGGEMVLHYPVADGDSHKAFIGESVQTIRTETARIPIKQKPQTIYTAGYSQKTENSKWSAAAEWNTATNAKGVSFAVEFALH